MQHKFSRHIKLLICVTLYNEDQETLGKTLLGICEVSTSLCPQGAARVQTSKRAGRQPSARRRAHPLCRFGPYRPPAQNLEVLYRQYGRDGNKHGLDWQEVAVAIIQDGVTHCDASVMAASTVQVRGLPGLPAGFAWQGQPPGRPNLPPCRAVRA